MLSLSRQRQRIAQKKGLLTASMETFSSKLGNLNSRIRLFPLNLADISFAFFFALSTNCSCTQMKKYLPQMNPEQLSATYVLDK